MSVVSSTASTLVLEKESAESESHLISINNSISRSREEGSGSHPHPSSLSVSCLLCLKSQKLSNTFGIMNVHQFSSKLHGKLCELLLGVKEDEPPPDLGQVVHQVRFCKKCFQHIKSLNQLLERLEEIQRRIVLIGWDIEREIFASYVGELIVFDPDSAGDQQLLVQLQGRIQKYVQYKTMVKEENDLSSTETEAHDDMMMMNAPSPAFVYNNTEETGETPMEQITSSSPRQEEVSISNDDGTDGQITKSPEPPQLDYYGFNDVIFEIEPNLSDLVTDEIVVDDIEMEHEYLTNESDQTDDDDESNFQDDDNILNSEDEETIVDSEEEANLLNTEDEDDLLDSEDEDEVSSSESDEDDDGSIWEGEGSDSNWEDIDDDDDSSWEDEEELCRLIKKRPRRSRPAAARNERTSIILPQIDKNLTVKLMRLTEEDIRRKVKKNLADRDESINENENGGLVEKELPQTGTGSETQSKYYCKPCEKDYMFRGTYLVHLTSQTHRTRVAESRNLQSSSISKPTSPVAGSSSSVPQPSQLNRVENSQDLKATQRSNTSINSVRHVCDLCPKNYKTSSLLKKHKIKHRHMGKLRFECGICGFIAKMKKQLARHRREENHWRGNRQEVTKRVVLNSSQVGKDAKQPTTTKKSSNRRRPFACDLCPKNYKKLSHLSDHKIEQHNVGGQRFECEICGFSAKLKRRLNLHMREGKHRQDKQQETLKRVDDSHQNSKIERAQEQQPSVKDVEVSNRKNSSPTYPCHGCEFTTKLKSLYKSHLKTCSKLRGIEISDSNTTGKTQSGSNADVGSIKTLPSVSDLNTNSLEEHQSVKENQVFSCNKCDFTKRSKDLVSAHVRNHHKNESGRAKVIKLDTTCPECKEGYSTARAMLEHRRAAHYSFKCDLCQKTFIRERYLNLHRTVHENENPKTEPEPRNPSVNKKIHSDDQDHKDKFQCKVSGKGTSSQNTLRGHMLSHNRQRNLECVTCHKKFSTNYNLKRHKWTHTNDRPHPHKCEACSKGFYEKYGLKRHQQRSTHGRVDKIQRFPCKTCGKSFSEAQALKYHQIFHENPEEFTCEFCKRTYSKPRTLTAHMQICELRDKGVASQDALKLHLLLQSHTGEKLCDICHQSFSTKNTLKRHKRIHANHRPRPHKCQTCSKAFFDKHTLKRHEQTHTGEKNFECKICQRKFSTNYKLQSHKRRHTNHRPFKCPTCSKTFYDRKALRNHEPIHSGETPFGCEICSKRFRVRRYLLAHMRLTHTEQMSRTKTGGGPLGHQTHNHNKKFRSKIKDRKTMNKDKRGCRRSKRKRKSTFKILNL